MLAILLPDGTRLDVPLDANPPAGGSYAYQGELYT